MPAPIGLKLMRNEARTSRKRAIEKKGRRAETMAGWLLRLKGYRLIEKRYKTRRGEIDLIAQKGGVLAIIEVKRRASLRAAQDSISAKARRRIMAASDDFLARRAEFRPLALRYDAIYVLPRLKIIHDKDVWRRVESGRR